jgi:hypothetical protein
MICDQTIVLTGQFTRHYCPQPLRRIKVRDLDSGKVIVLLSNNLDLPGTVIADLYRCRWQIEIFFKWVKQHLRIKAFFGTSENAVRTQIWIAISAYVLVAIVRKRLALEASLYTILQILSLTAFEKVPINQLFLAGSITPASHHDSNQLNLFA